jgi:ATP-dependent protease La (LON) substrate-binding domain
MLTIARCPPCVPRLVPFSAPEVFLPGETKVLHLFESKCLSLFEVALERYQGKFCHILVSHERSALAAAGTLVCISEWERLELGVRVRLDAIARVQVHSVADTATPFTCGRVSIIDDVKDDDGDGREESQAPALESLLVKEAEFWTCGERIISQAVSLGLFPFRSKEDVEPPTLEDTVDVAKTGKAFIPPAASMTNEEKVEFYMKELAKSITRASWPLVKGTSAVVGPEENALVGPEENARHRLRGVSFVGFDLFDSEPGQRQRALELQSTSERLDRVLACCRSKVQLLGAQLSLRNAFASMQCDDTDDAA